MVGTLQNYEQKNIDNDIPGPPTNFTRRRDGILIPSLHRFMGGYNYLFKLKRSSKNLETGFNILNCVCWTNQKDDLARQAGGGGGGGGPGLWHLQIFRINCTPPVWMWGTEGLFCLKWLWVTWIEAELELSGAYMLSCYVHYRNTRAKSGLWCSDCIANTGH